MTVPPPVASQPFSFALTLGLCALFVRLVISPALLNAMGFPYEGEEGGFWLAKIHPSTWLILCAFCLALIEGDHPAARLRGMIHRYKSFFALLVMDGVAAVYWMIRDPSGVGIMLDTHIAAPLLGLVLSVAAPRLCRRILCGVMGVAVINAMIGISESAGAFRLFPFDDTAPFMREEFFRASALLGHPLNNALFTGVMVPIALTMPMRGAVRVLILGLLMGGLVAFGGRAAFVVALGCLVVFGWVRLRDQWRAPCVALGQRLRTIGLAVLAVLALGGWVVVGTTSNSMGERLQIMGSAADDSAATRWASLHAMDTMGLDDILFGVSMNRVGSITDQMGARWSIETIENPWILMFMLLGGVLFPIWLVAMLVFLGRLAWHQPLGIQMAVIAYVLIASTSNSFGRKELVFAVMVAVVTCAARAWSPGDKAVESGRMDA